MFDSCPYLPDKVTALSNVMRLLAALSTVFFSDREDFKGHIAT
jgi:hypothetical protein